MNKCKGIWKLGSAGLAVLAILYAGVVTGAEVPGEKQVTPQVQEEEVPKPPEKPPEKPLELPELMQRVPSTVPTTTFEAGPSYGTFAPYGYGAAYDTLSRGWEKHKLGPVVVSPFFEYDGIYRTNIYQSSFDKKSDFVNAINPGIRFELPMAKTHRLSVGYLGNYFIYSHYNNNSHYDHNLNADATFNFPRLSLRMGNTLRMATEERTAQNLRQRDYTRESPYIGATYKFADRWRLEGNYQFEALEFAKQVDNQSNYQYHTAAWSLNYKFWPKTAALVQYILLFRQHPDNSIRNNTTHTPLLGLTWDPTAKLSGTVKVGYTFTDYYTKIPSRNNNPNSWAMSVQTLYRFSRYTNLSLIAQRSIQEDADVNNNAYLNTGMFFTLSHLFHYFNVNSYAGFSFYQNAYQENSFDGFDGEFKRRIDTVVSAGGGLSRPFTRWLRLRVDYVYNNKASNFAGFSYNEHKVLLGAQTSF